jgi:malate synthase
MEDAATAEISRAQLWQWIRHRCRLVDGRVMSSELYLTVRQQELVALGGPEAGRRGEAAALLDALVLAAEFAEFLTLPAYPLLDGAPTTES